MNYWEKYHKYKLKYQLSKAGAFGENNNATHVSLGLDLVLTNDFLELLNIEDIADIIYTYNTIYIPNLQATVFWERFKSELSDFNNDLYQLFRDNNFRFTQNILRLFVELGLVRHTKFTYFPATRSIGIAFNIRSSPGNNAAKIENTKSKAFPIYGSPNQIIKKIDRLLESNGIQQWRIKQQGGMNIISRNNHTADFDIPAIDKLNGYEIYDKLTNAIQDFENNSESWSFKPPYYYYNDDYFNFKYKNQQHNHTIHHLMIYPQQEYYDSPEELSDSEYDSLYQNSDELADQNKKSKKEKWGDNRNDGEHKPRYKSHRDKKKSKEYLDVI